MEKSRDSFVFYRSFMESIEEADSESQLRLYRAIAHYALNQEEPQLKGMEKAVWLVVKPQLDANFKRFLNGCKGGAPKGSINNPTGRRGKGSNDGAETTPKTNQELTKNKPNVNDNVNVNDNNKEISSNEDRKKGQKSPSSFVPPSTEEVRAYCVERGYAVDAEAFRDHYESKGWMVGKSPMKDWKAAVRTWVRRQAEFSRGTSGDTTHERRMMDFEEHILGKLRSPDTEIDLSGCY